MSKFNEVYDMLMEDIKLKSKKTPIKTINLKDKKGEDIEITVRPSKNNYLEFEIKTTEKDGQTFSKYVYLANEVFTYLNNKISPKEKTKLNVLHELSNADKTE